MTKLSNLKNEIKLDSIKTFFAVTIIILLGWGVSSSAVDDIRSATANFNVIGIVSEISDKQMTVKDAKGSNSPSDTTYNLNLDYLSKIETSTYIPLNLSDIKVGDKIIAQGLTSNSTFFIKRIISFDSIATPVIPKDVATTTATTTTMDDIIIATTTDVGTSTLTEDVIDESTGGSSDTSTPVVTTPVNTTSTTTATTTESFSTTTPDVTSTTTATTTNSIIDTITSTIGDVIDTVVDVVQTVVDTVVGSSTPNITVDTVQENPPQEIPVQGLIDNSSSITLPIN
jgi:hypothetical protein